MNQRKIFLIHITDLRDSMEFLVIWRDFKGFYAISRIIRYLKGFQNIYGILRSFKGFYVISKNYKGFKVSYDFLGLPNLSRDFNILKVHILKGISAYYCIGFLKF